MIPKQWLKKRCFEDAEWPTKIVGVQPRKIGMRSTTIKDVAN
jgi:hypothetical protein